jgi:hypothetical protein
VVGGGGGERLPPPAHTQSARLWRRPFRSFTFVARVQFVLRSDGVLTRVLCLFQSERARDEHGIRGGRVAQSAAAPAHPPPPPAPTAAGWISGGEADAMPAAAAGMPGRQAAEGVQPRPPPPSDAAQAGTGVLDVR